MPKDYFHMGEYKLSIELRKLEGIPQPNRNYAISYKEYLEANNRKALTLYRRLSELRLVLNLIGKKDVKTLTKNDIEAIVREINKAKRKTTEGEETDTDLADISKGKIKLTFKAFIKWLYNASEYPEIVKWIKIDQGINNKLPEDMLTQEEIEKLIDVCKNQRDKTIIALLWDTGMRIGEMLNIKIRDITLSKNSISHVVVSGKTGMRKTPLIFSVPYLSNFLNDERKNSKIDDQLFTIIDHNSITNRPLDYPHILKLLHDLKERSKINKRIHPHLFRHSRATFYANKLTEQQAKIYFGWTKDSSMMAKYVHLSGRDVDDAILKANGLSDKESIKPKPQIKRCEKCHTINEITATYCTNCGSPLNISAVEQIEQIDTVQQELNDLKGAVKLLINTLDKDTKEKILKALDKK